MLENRLQQRKLECKEVLKGKSILYAETVTPGKIQKLQLKLTWASKVTESYLIRHKLNFVRSVEY